MKKHPADGARARARTLRQNMTEAERRLWQILRSHQMKGYKFRRQAPIGRYIADFVCHEARLIVEIDGGQHDSLVTAGSRAKRVPAKRRLSHSVVLEQRGLSKSRRRP
jgi:very-short-patch-repair endonuclease